MKSDVYELNSLETDFRQIPAEAERVAVYSKLDAKSAMRLRLLAEEMICMLPQLLIYGKGKFWIENKGRRFDLRLRVYPDRMEDTDRDQILSVSKSGKNAAAVGIVGRICAAVEAAMSDRAKFARNDPVGAYMADISAQTGTMAWSLVTYRNTVNKDESAEAWDELEKSILANLADDVTVGLLSGKVDITVTKEF